MNLFTVLDHAGPQLDAIGKRTGEGDREKVACRLLLEAIARELGAVQAPGDDGRFARLAAHAGARR